MRGRIGGGVFVILLAPRALGGESNLAILDTGNMLHDAVAVRRPCIDAEGEMSSRCGHRHPPEGKVVEGGDCHE